MASTWLCDETETRPIRVSKFEDVLALMHEAKCLLRILGSDDVQLQRKVRTKARVMAEELGCLWKELAIR